MNLGEFCEYCQEWHNPCPTPEEIWGEDGITQGLRASWTRVEEVRRSGRIVSPALGILTAGPQPAGPLRKKAKVI